VATGSIDVIEKRLNFGDIEDFTKNFFTSLSKRDLPVVVTSTSAAEAMNSALQHLNHTAHQLKSHSRTNSSAALLASSLHHMKTTLNSNLTPEEKAVFAEVAGNFTSPANAPSQPHSRRDPTKAGTIAGDAGSFLYKVYNIFDGLLESVKKRGAAKASTIVGDAGSFLWNVWNVFSDL
jgi:hypothetical protein